MIRLVPRDCCLLPSLRSLYKMHFQYRCIFIYFQ
jgi:hypothetical protein